MKSIRIQENDKPVLTVCKMNCDNQLHEKLDKYELSKFLNSHSTNSLIGRPRSGKTSLLYSLFKSPELLKKVFKKIFIFQPSASRASMKDKIFNQLPENQLYEELDYDNLKEVMDTIQDINSQDPTYTHCIIFDDMTAYLKNKDTMKILKELIFNRRHLHTSIYFLVQSWYSVPKDIRKLFSNIFVFKVSKNEMENIFEEVVELDKKYIPEITKVVFDEPYSYLFINTESQRMFRQFDELIIDN